MVGNMISDFVKGKKKFDYPAGIQKGIMLHRHIDNFTDTHEATREAKEIFRPHYRLYSGAFVDVVYDHFLAIEPAEFTESSLHDFSQQVYFTLDKQAQWLPEKFALMFPYMKEHNWLFNYRTSWGTGKSLGGVVRRSVHLTESETAYQLFEEHYQLLQDCFRHFWASVKPFARKQFDILQSE
ncbi:MAG: ACP phosphodiesterase [Chitinophagaceae bacterium]|nr:ACP phosphodiesterase [Chitinophagaceae bacterium]